METCNTIETPFLNILIRTSGRPLYFERMLASIQWQTCKSYRLIVSADTDDTARYVRAAGIEPVIVERLEKTAAATFPWNLYLNTLMDKVAGGWIMFMDDDDMYSNRHVFEILLSKMLSDKNAMVVWQMKFPDGRLVPGEQYWQKTPFTRRQIAMPCFAFHSKWKDHVRFDAQKGADFRMANLLNQGLNVQWLQVPLVTLSNFGNKGKRTDLNDEIKYNQ